MLMLELFLIVGWRSSTRNVLTKYSRDNLEYLDGKHKIAEGKADRSQAANFGVYGLYV